MSSLPFRVICFGEKIRKETLSTGRKGILRILLFRVSWAMISISGMLSEVVADGVVGLSTIRISKFTAMYLDAFLELDVPMHFFKVNLTISF